MTHPDSVRGRGLKPGQCCECGNWLTSEELAEKHEFTADCEMVCDACTEAICREELQDPKNFLGG